MKNHFIHLSLLALITILISSCGGGGGGSGSGGTATPPDTTDPAIPSSITVTSTLAGIITVTGVAEPGSTVTVTFPDGSPQSATADDNGNISFTITSATAQLSGDITIESEDSSGNKSEAKISADDVTRVLYKATGTMPALSFKPSLGINTEQPQGGSDAVAVPVPFVDIFRTARPFQEFAKKPKKDALGNQITDDEGRVIYIDATTVFDSNGWPTQLDPDLSFPGSNTGSAKTKLLQASLNNSIPSGVYTVLYEGNGVIDFGTGGPVSNHNKNAGDHKNTFDLTMKTAVTAETNAINLIVTGVSPGEGNYLKNIRIVMPGGTCKDSQGKHNPFIRVSSIDECPSNHTYESFEERLSADRNTIIFNPDYLLFMRNFKVIRMMNLMEASLKHTCSSKADCPAALGTWNDRATMDDAVWGGSDDPNRTPYEKHKGAPIEVIVDLANSTKRDLWINIPHFAKDDYIQGFAEYVYANLDETLNVYIEYSNEVWNSQFAGYDYTTSEGLLLGYGTLLPEIQTYCDGLTDEGRQAQPRCQAEYFARFRYYSERSVSIFNIWKTAFNDSNNRFKRILGSNIGDPSLSGYMIDYAGQSNVDSIAIAPYFFGCINRASCPNASKTLLEATTVDDIFTVINESAENDVKSLEGVIKTIKEFQLEKTFNKNVDLITYEGGQHLVVNAVPAADRDRVRALFNQANRDPRMKEAYLKLLNEWKAMSPKRATLFTMYTVPRTNSDYGDFGLKDHLNSPRKDSPKFDAAMSFQESEKKCWWDESDCNP